MEKIFEKQRIEIIDCSIPQIESEMIREKFIVFKITKINFQSFKIKKVCSNSNF